MKIPLPDRGQPLDVAYMYQLADSINALYNQIATTTYNYLTIDTAEAGRQSVQTGRSMIHAGTVKVASNEYIVKDATKAWHIDLPPGFKYAPNVTATVINKGASAIGSDVIVTVTNVTASRVDGMVKFLSSGTLSVNVNVQAIGVPE